MKRRVGTTEGPSVTVVRSCFTCVHMRGAPGEDGVGVRVTCEGAKDTATLMSSLARGREIGWSSWKTPDWCPVLVREVEKCMRGIEEARRLMGLPPEVEELESWSFEGGWVVPEGNK